MMATSRDGCATASQTRIARLNEFHKFCCGRIDPTQAVKATGFNHREHREHRVFKSILCVPLWLYFLLMSFVSVAMLCIQLTITEFHEFNDGQEVRR
jgi:hypothetical protein